MAGVRRAAPETTHHTVRAAHCAATGSLCGNNYARTYASWQYLVRSPGIDRSRRDMAVVGGSCSTEAPGRPVSPAARRRPPFFSPACHGGKACDPFPSVVPPIGRERIINTPIPIPYPRPRPRQAPGSRAVDPNRLPRLPAATAPYHGARVPNRRTRMPHTIPGSWVLSLLTRAARRPLHCIAAPPARAPAVVRAWTWTLAVITTSGPGVRLTQPVKISRRLARADAGTTSHARAPTRRRIGHGQSQ